MKMGTAAAAIALLGEPVLAQGKPLKVLILGGTGFIGPHFVEILRAGGHEITLFNRGRSNPGLFPDIETLIGDRDGKIDALEGHQWNVVIDDSGYLPRQVQLTADLLKDQVQHYIFISSISAYGDFPKAGLDEDDGLAQLKDPTVEEITGETYGGLKALCEQVVERVYGSRCAVMRPSYVVGPGDPTDRFTYWPVRVARGGEVLAPGSAGHPIQFIDVRDLAEFVVRCIEHKTFGVFNATGPDRTVTIGELLESCKEASKSDATFTWVPAEFLEKHNVSAWQDMPVWVPSTGDSAGFHRVKYQKAAQAGMTFRPLMTTVEDTLKWFKGLPKERQEKLKAGIASEREKVVLAAWKAAK